MYLDFFYVFKDYIKSLRREHVFFEIVVPFIISMICFLLISNDDWELSYSAVKTSMGILGDLLGFSLAAVALFLTGNNQIEKLKEEIAKNMEIDGKPVSLYRLVVSYFSIAIIEEILLCIAYLIGSLFPIEGCNTKVILMNCLFIFVFLHVLFLSVRAITCIYLTLIANS